MAPSARTTASPTRALRLDPVEFTTRLAATLSAADQPTSAAAAAAEAIRGAFAARACAVWRREGDELSLVSGTSGALHDARQVASWLVAPRDGAMSVPIVSGARELGVLVIETDGPRPAGSESAAALAAHLLAPTLLALELVRRLEAEVALRTEQIEDQRRFIETVIDSLPVGLYVIDRDYQIQLWNRKRETGMLGVSREEAVGKPIFEILHRQPADVLRQEFEDVFATATMRQFDMESAASGESRHYRVTKIPMSLDPRRQVTHVITIGEDMTGWKAAQQRVAQAEKLAAVGQLAAGVMHEINNPLATIGACAESMTLALDEPEISDDVRGAFDDYLKIVDSEVHRCKRIIDGLLHFSRPKSSIRTDCDVNLVLGETLFLLKHHARFKQMTVETDFDRDLGPIVHGNPEQLIQVFMALLLNATDAMDGRGTIGLRTYRGDSPSTAVVVEVRDRGEGIPGSEVQKIFEPFYTTKPPGRGTGLGLSICYGIIADHGGRIEVDSALGHGTTFSLYLPARAGSREFGAAIS